MTLIYFSSKYDFREWLSKNHQIENEVFIGFYKVSTGKPSLTWSDSVDVALCFGWIDGIRKSIDTESYCIRFTPRKPTSVWSLININKVEQLINDGLMQPAGLEAYQKRRNDKSGIYSFENDNRKLDNQLEKMFMDNEVAWEYFSNQAPSYRKTVIHWIISAKQDKTKLARLQKAITASKEKTRVM